MLAQITSVQPRKLDIERPHMLAQICRNHRGTVKRLAPKQKICIGLQVN